MSAAGATLSRVLAVVAKEFALLRRDRRMVFIIVVTPLIQLVLFGYAVNTDIRHVATAVRDGDGSAASRDLVARMIVSGYFDVVERAARPAELVEALEENRALVALDIPPGFGARLRAGRGGAFQVLVDGTDSNTASGVIGFAAGFLDGYARELARGLPGGAGGGAAPAILIWYNPELRSRDFNIPGILAMLLMVVVMMLSSMAIVKERELGTMEQLIVTPITPGQLIVGKTVPFVLIGLFDVTLIAAVAILWFGIPFRGSFLLLYASVGLYLLTALGIGLFISTISRTQQQALMSTFMFLMPAVILSGFMFPIANMPDAVQYLTYLNPLRYFVVIVRSIFLKGSGLAVLWPQLAALAAFGTVILSLAASRFTKTLD